MRLVQGQVGTILADHANRTDEGLRSRSLCREARVRCNDADGKDRHRRNRGGASRLSCSASFDLNDARVVPLRGYRATVSVNPEFAAAALAGVYGNDADVAMYSLAKVDRSGESLDGSKHQYTLSFAKDHLPPVRRPGSGAADTARQLALISIRRGCARAALGIRRLSTPFRSSAVT